MILSSADIFFKISLFLVVALFMPDVLSCLIWIQIVCKGNQQTTLVSKEFMTTIQV